MKNEKPDFSVKSHIFPPIHREGLKFGWIAVAVALAVPVLLHKLFWSIFMLQHYYFYTMFCGALLAVLLLAARGVFLFFRDPERVPPADPKAIVSPADGRVCMIKDLPLPQELLADAQGLSLDPAAQYTRVSVFMSVFNVHVNRMPFAAKVLKKVHVKGKFLNAAVEKASEENERCCWLLETPEGVRFAVVQIAGLVARRIVPFAEEGRSLERAERFGLIRFGSRLDVYLPAGVKPEVLEGQIMVAGETALGRFA